MYVMNFRKEEPEVLLKNLILIFWLVRKREKEKVDGERKTTTESFFSFRL